MTKAQRQERRPKQKHIVQKAENNTVKVSRASAAQERKAAPRKKMKKHAWPVDAKKARHKAKVKSEYWEVCSY